MANEQLIDELVSPKAYDQLDRLEKGINQAKLEFESLARAVALANTGLTKGTGYSDYNKSIQESNILNEKLTQQIVKTKKVQEDYDNYRRIAAFKFEADVQKQIQVIEKKASKSQQSSEKERLAQIKLEQDRKKSFDSYEKDVKKKESLEKKNAEQIAKNSRPYNVLSNELEKQRRLAQDLAIIYGEESEQFLNAAKGVIELDTRLKAIDATLGKHTRNVGNYKSGFDQFSNSINQITRELPSMAVNMQTFFLAISNNLPALFDAIQNANTLRKEAVDLAHSEAEAQGVSAKATALAGGATEEAASAAGDFAKEQALAAAEALKTPGAFKQFIGSLFSLQTVLSIGVTLLTLYGAELISFIGDLIKGGAGLDTAAKRIENLNKAFDDPSISDAVKNIGELTINVDLAKKGLLDKEKVLKQYNESIGKTTGEVDSLDQAERALGKNAKAYVQMTLYKAAAQITLEEAAKASVKAAQEAAERERALVRQTTSFVIQGDKEGEAARKILVKSRKQSNNEQVKDDEESNNQLLAIAKKFQEDAAAIAKNNNFDFFGDGPEKDKKINTDSVDLLIQRVQFEADKQKEIAGNEKNSLDERLAAIKNSYDASIRLSELNAKKELSEAGLSADRIKAIKEKQANDVAVATTEQLNANVKLNEDANKKLADLIKEGLKDYEEGEKKKIEALQVSLAEQSALNQEFADNALLGLSEQYSKGLINEFQYAKGKLDIQRQYVIDSLNQELDGIQRIIDAKKAAGLSTADDEKALSALRKKLSKETADQEITDLEKVAEMSKKLADKKQELGKEAANLAISLVNASFTNQKNKLQEEQDAYDLQTQKEIENVNESVATQEEKANAIKIIEARAAAQKVVQDQKQRELDQRKARFDKAAQAASIIGNTAVAIMKTYAEFGFPLGIPLAIAQGAIGAVQLATVLGTPIPKYKYGKEKNDGYSGPAIVGDGYEHELRIDPGGKVSLTPDRPTLTTVSSGTQIIGGADLKRMMARPDLPAYVSNTSVDISALVSEQKNSTKEIKNAVGKIKLTSNNITRFGWFKTQSDMKNMNDYINNNFG